MQPPSATMTFYVAALTMGIGRQYMWLALLIVAGVFFWFTKTQLLGASTLRRKINIKKIKWPHSHLILACNRHF